ncbi:MAG TPA: hypothetical protein VFK06_25050 [Candidatus Angelobacter sp.]|nr:hypothetical protein [Candidatus Angelobacter sp.]
MRKLLKTLVFLSILPLIACGRGGGNPGSSPQQIVSVSVNPPSGFTGFIGITQTLQFTAGITGTTNTGVTWAVNNIAGGNSSVGTVNSSGLYTAPSQIPNPQKISVTATSQVDATKSATTNIFISRIPPTGSWQRTGPPGGTITILAEDVSNPGTVYADTNDAGNGALWKSTDAGLHWVTLITNTLLDGDPVSDMNVPASGGGKVIYIAAGTLFLSSQDAGATWKTITTPAFGRQMAVDPQNRAVIYLTSPGNGVLKSQDGGDTWTLLPSSPVITLGSLTGDLHNPLHVDLSRSATVYSGTDHGLFISRDGGVTWSPSTNGIAPADTVVLDVAGAPADTSRVFALIGPAGSHTMNLYQTTDQGNSWTLLASSLDAQRVVPDPANAATLYLYGLQVRAAYKSADGGHTFSPSDTGLPSGPASDFLTLNGAFIPLVRSPNTFLITIGGLGVSRSSDGAASWSFTSDGISSWLGVVVAVDPQTPATVYLGTANTGGIWKSTDNGVTWVNLRHNQPHAIAVDPFDSNHLLAAAFDEGVIESRDGGTTWQKVTNLPPPPGGFATITEIIFHPTVRDVIFLSSTGGGAGIVKSTNGGISWSLATTGLTTDKVLSVAVNPQASSMLFAGTAKGVFKSTDLGNSWTLKTGTVALLISIDAKVSPPAIYIDGAKSTDQGETWNAVPNASTIIVDPSTANSLFTVNFDLRTVRWSPDGGATWFPLTTGLGQPNLVLGFAGLGGGGLAIAPSSPQVLYVASSSNSIVRFVIGP